MPVSLEIIPIPLGSQLTSTIAQDEPEDKNDFPVLFIFDSNVSGLTESGITLSSGATLVSLEGANSVWMGWVRPPQTAGIVTVTVNQNAVSEGNPQTSKDIRVSTNFPDVDAETPSLLFNNNELNAASGLAVSPTRIIANRGTETVANVAFFTHAGVYQSSETLTASIAGTAVRMDYLNGTLLLAGHQFYRAAARFSLRDLSRIESYSIPSNIGIIDHTRFGVIGIFNNTLYIQPYGTTASADLIQHTLTPGQFGYRNIAHQDDLLYLVDRGFSTNIYALAEVSEEDGLIYRGQLNINRPSGGLRDIALYRDSLYMLGVNNGNIYTLDIRKYRPIAKNTKTTIYPQRVAEGGTLDLTPFSPDAERFVFDVGYDKPDFLTINANNQIAVASNAVTETTPILVKLKGINRIDATETNSFQFYLIIEQATAPVWREVDALTMPANSSYDLFQLVDADSIAFRSRRSRPTGSRLSNGVFRIGAVGGRVEFTATKGSRTTHIAFDVDVVLPANPENFSDVFRHRVEIAGIDVSVDVREFPTVSKSLDVIELNRYRVDDATLTLSDEGGKYNPDLAGNFWSTNNLNPGGFNEPIKIHIESLVDERWVSSLLFAGNIIEQAESISEIEVKLTCVDIANRLQKQLVSDFGTLEKWDHLRKQSDEDSFEGVYVPERSLLPMQVGTGKAWRDGGTKLTISRLQLPSEGPIASDTAYMTPGDFRTAGGFLEENPILQFNGEHLSEDARFLINQLAVNKSIYNTHIELPEMTLSDPFILNRGSVAFSIEQTRITRLPVDWVQGVRGTIGGQGTGTLPNRLLILLSNPEGHIADQLVQYDLNSDSYRVLHTFDKDIAVHRIERRNATNYYILTSGKITQDRSATPLPRQTDATGYAYDSAAEGSEIKIYHYSTSTGTLTEHVAEDDSFPPQLGIHYHVGFENDLYIDEFEGIVKDYRGTFRWYSNNLYYRYATDSEFGVARVNTGGTTTKMVGQARGGNWDHLNFAFDINSSGTIYFVYAGAAKSETHTVVSNYNLAQSGDVPIADDLSSYNGEFQLQVNITGHHTTSLQIVGTDAEGNTVSAGGNIPNSQTEVIYPQKFATITRITERFTRGRLTITTVPVDGTELVIKRRTSDGTETTVLQRFETYGSLTDLDENGGVYLGCHEALFHNNHLYLLVPIGRVDYDADNDEYTRSREKAAGMVLYRCNVTAGTPSLTVVDTWDFVQLSGGNLTVHDGAVHYVEHPPAAQMFKPINPDIDTYPHQTTGTGENEKFLYNIVPDPLGALKRIKSNGEVEELGNLWFEERPYNIAATRCLSFDGDLHLMMGYGNLDEVLKYSSLASGADNFQHIVYGKTLRYVVPRFSPDGSIYEALADLARKLNSTLVFDNNLISIQERSPYRAETDGSTGTETGNLAYANANKRFPNSGYLRIGKEILSYTGIQPPQSPLSGGRNGMFTGIVRGVLGTEIASHADGAEIVHIDTAFGKERLSGDIHILEDTARIHNIIRDGENRFEVRDDDSVETFGELPYTLSLGLTRHEKAWQERMFANYLASLKDAHSLINLRLKPSFFLGLGDFVGVRYFELVYAMQIVSITYNGDSTVVRVRTL